MTTPLPTNPDIDQLSASGRRTAAAGSIGRRISARRTRHVSPRRPFRSGIEQGLVL